MKKNKNGLFYSMLISTSFLFCLVALGTHAQLKEPRKTRPVAATQPEEPAKAQIPGTVKCFDYYKFGSVQVQIESSVLSIDPGLPLTLTGKIINQNNYPIVDGSVYVKVFRKSTSTSVQANGYDLVDQFFAQDDISLDANQSKDIKFEWKVPANAVLGDYQIATFFTSAKKFNLLGLTFTDDIVGNTANFSVKGNNTATVTFDKNTVTLNNASLKFAAFLQRFKKDQSVIVSANLQNHTMTAEDIPVTWTLYSWDAQKK